MRIRWTPSAVADMQAVSDYLKTTARITASRLCASSTAKSGL